MSGGSRLEQLLGLYMSSTVFNKKELDGFPLRIFQLTAV